MGQPPSLAIVLAIRRVVARWLQSIPDGVVFVRDTHRLAIGFEHLDLNPLALVITQLIMFTKFLKDRMKQIKKLLIEIHCNCKANNNE